MLYILNLHIRVLCITCITTSDDEHATGLVGEILLGEGWGANEETLAESIHVGRHDFLLLCCEVQWVVSGRFS
jgi:hypothetical protein